MRTGFVQALLEEARARADIMLLTADLGFSVLERFRDALPRQFLNVGVAEQNMIGIAAGLADVGRTVFTYSIANFPTMRCLEQIRNDVCYHGYKVRVVSVGGGLAYASQGYTHHGVEDIGVMRALPGMVVIAPGDPAEAACATKALCDLPGPAYLRLGKAGEPRVHGGPIDFAIGRAIEVASGSDVALVSTGGMLVQAMETAQALRRDGIAARVLSMHTVKPLDERAVRRALAETRLVVTVEEHNVGSGLGAAVAQVVAAFEGPRARFRMFGLPDEPYSRVGGHAYMREMMGDLKAVVLEGLRR
ncbi:MAG TPA: transketolase C-terminal domain-containing protein [Usitatibacter sp.]|nr:transketolase C-terminal domain-containing protein [Usitatibacter sp.]